uniref:Uncharacterized protein n=1 Tax=Hyaloperonospora arabidopsidis (strain Emoy2) TaxID=559515 RepID=M4BCM8_HYAAE
MVIDDLETRAGARFVQSSKAMAQVSYVGTRAQQFQGHLPSLISSASPPPWCSRPRLRYVRHLKPRRKERGTQACESRSCRSDFDGPEVYKGLRYGFQLWTLRPCS